MSTTSRCYHTLKTAGEGTVMMMMMLVIMTVMEAQGRSRKHRRCDDWMVLKPGALKQKQSVITHDIIRQREQC